MGFFINGGFGMIFFLLFALVIGVFILTAIRGISQWNKNNHSPRLEVEATVVAKREEVTHHQHNTGNNTTHLSTSTWYYITFQVKSGDRMELGVNGHEYGMLVEGDFGRLTFQGPRYISFERSDSR